MKKIWLITCILPMLGLFVTASAQENPLHLGGELYLDNRFRLESGEWSWNENRLDLQLDKRFGGKARFHSQVWLRTFGFPFLNQAEQLFNTDQTSPYNLQIREAYVEFYDLIVKNLDVRIGRQRIAWGTADKLNPTDNLNAYDLEDIWDFGRHHGSDAIRARYYFSDFYLEGDYIPFFRPATLPRGDWAAGLAGPVTVPPGFYIAEMTDSLAAPSLKIGESATYALKFGGFAGGFDFSASYVYGREGLPVGYLSKISFANMEGGLAVRNYMYFPRLHIVGLDMAGAIRSVGVWAEAAAFIPTEAWKLTMDLSALGVPDRDSILVENEPWFKVAAGFDYTFRGGHYLNVQYLHGFVHEQGRGNLNDYFVMNYEKRFFNEKLKVQPATLAFVVSDWKDIADNYALVYMPFITYMPNINAEIFLGVRLIGGKGDDVFAQYKDKDEFVFGLRYRF
ncbi:MAG: DUF1302 family protein [Bacteroidales bacterium]